MNQTFLYLVGGLGMFLYGMTQLSDGLQKLAGSRLRNFVRAASDNRVKGVLLGAGVTSIVQSSSVTTVMLAGLLNAGIMTLEQSIGVIYGANIGTTITAQIIAFKISKYALLMIATGFAMNFFIRSQKLKVIGLSILSLGFIFLGLKFMTDAFVPLRSSTAVMEFTAGLSQHPLLAILCGLILTVLVQSSSGSIGITIAMASTGLIDFTAALYILLGDNIGTTVTAWMASIGGAVSSRQMALCHSLFNIIGACYFSILIHSGIYTQIIERITPGALDTDSVARHIANAHSLFNITNSVVLFAFIPLLAWIAKKAFRGEGVVHTGETKFIDDHLIDTPEIAMGQLVKELHHMGEISRESFIKASEGFLQNNSKSAAQSIKLEQAVDSLQQDITRYIVKICARPLSDELSNRVPSLLHSVNDLEKISDYAENIAKMAFKRQEADYPVSEAAAEELQTVFDHTRKMFDDSLEMLRNLEPSETGKKVFMQEDALDEMKTTHIANHVARLKSKECHPLAGLAFVSYHNYLEKIGDHLMNVTEAVLGQFIYDYGSKETAPSET